MSLLRAAGSEEKEGEKKKESRSWNLVRCFMNNSSENRGPARFLCPAYRKGNLIHARTLPLSLHVRPRVRWPSLFPRFYCVCSGTTGLVAWARSPTTRAVYYTARRRRRRADGDRERTLLRGGGGKRGRGKEVVERVRGRRNEWYAGENVVRVADGR